MAGEYTVSNIPGGLPHEFQNKNRRSPHEGNYLYRCFYRFWHLSDPSACDYVPPKGTVYHPGVYSSALHLGSQEVNVEVTVDAVEITGVTLVPLSDSVSAMYPLVAPSAKNLSGQICATQSLKNLTYPQESKYTSQALIRAVERALAKASVSTTETLFPGL